MITASGHGGPKNFVSYNNHCKILQVVNDILLLFNSQAGNVGAWRALLRKLLQQFNEFVSPCVLARIQAKFKW